ncbi:hypothetical protein [Bacillus massiliglaciei]|uniref:hypothetical protein n=1 Tax=Bacillus massiliglaciei TaxID=1816693 RepID=UPI000DA63E24|nr:hypothetical protein [Bacillus massiliglaciei]
MAKKKDHTYTANGRDKQAVTIQTDNQYPNKKFIPGDSIDEYTDLKDANQYIAEKEIGQQMENQ